MKTHGDGIVAQSGGPTAVINNSLAGIISEWQKRAAAGTLYGSLFGIKGILQGNLINLSAQNREAVAGLMHTPGAALGSCRYMLKTESDYRELLQNFKKLKIRYFFYIGGNDSMDTADKIHKLALREGYEMRILGIPKTIDNDLQHTDHCPGFGSAAKYLATSVMEAGLDLEGLITDKRVVIHEVMGRNAGWLAAATVLARKSESAAPHLVYLPEVPFRKQSFIEDVLKVYRELGFVYVVVSEGLVDEQGKYLFAAQGKDSFGHSQLGGLADLLKALVEMETGLKVRCNVLGTMQRAAAHYASLVDAEEAYLAGAEAVRLAFSGLSGLMVTLVREKEDYFCRTGSVELDKVANLEKKVPREWITAQGNDLAADFLRYAAPLVRGRLAVPELAGLPNYARLHGFDARKLRVSSREAS